MSMDKSERRVIALVITVAALGLVAFITWSVTANARDAHARQWGAHCVCSQQTCFQAPDGGWQQ